MRALVVAYYFPPLGGGGVNRTLKLVRGMAAAGWQPLVLTVDDAAWTRDPDLLARVPPRARVLRVPNPDWGRIARWRDRRAGSAGEARERGAGSGRLRRWLVPDLHAGWSALCVPVVSALAATRAVDVVFTTAPPYSATAAGFAASLFGVPWVADFRDAWTDCPTRADLPPWRQRLERALERRVFERADRVIFASEAVRARSIARVPQLRARSETVLTGFDAAEFAAFADVAPPVGRLEVVHAGGIELMNRGATLDRFLEALSGWAARDPRVRRSVRVRFVGAEASVARRFARAGVSDFVRAEPSVPRAALPARLARSHVCLALASATASGADPIPGKLFDAAGAERPLLAVTPDGALARLVRARGLGAVVRPDDPEGIAAVLGRHLERALHGVPIPGPMPDGRWALSNERAVAQILAALEHTGCPSPSAS